MVSSFTARGIALAGLLAAMCNGCVRFGVAVIGGDGAVDSAPADAASADSPDGSDVSALDAGEPDASEPDASALDADAGEPDAAEASLPDVAPLDAPSLDAPVRCVQNDDCADPGRPLCNVTTGRCVGCLSSPDTCPLRRYCDTATETCQDGCLDDRDCAPVGGGDAGSLPRRCDPVRHTCGECFVDADCPPGVACTGGTCVASTGATVISGATLINTARAAVSGAAGSTTLWLGETVGAFPVGAQVLIHQTQSRAGDAGRYELRRVVAAEPGSLTLEAALSRGYTTDSLVGARAQAVLVQEYTDLYVSVSGSLSAPEWNGRHGGILAVDVAGDAVIEGRISMDGRGFRGSSHACGAGLYRCQSGVAGESPTGVGSAGRPANGGGGGGGGAGGDCGAGGGGAYGGVGASGAEGDCEAETDGGVCAAGCPNPGGVGGGAYGDANLSEEMQLGSAGGEGGGDEDGETPGGGGNGGGVVWLRAGRAAEVHGAVTAAGSEGLDGNQRGCGMGEGCGMGGGGGGSGGAVRLAAATRVTLGADRVRSPGGGGGV
nr:hypothetical protein [Deltaproteobacteria bacterium]